MLAGSSHQACRPLINTQAVVVVVSIVSMLQSFIVSGGGETIAVRVCMMCVCILGSCMQAAIRCVPLESALWGAVDVDGVLGLGFHFPYQGFAPPFWGGRSLNCMG